MPEGEIVGRVDAVLQGDSEADGWALPLREAQPLADREPLALPEIEALCAAVSDAEGLGVTARVTAPLAHAVLVAVTVKDPGALRVAEAHGEA